MRRLTLLLLALALLCSAALTPYAPAVAKVHTWQDEQGVLHFSKNPPPGAEKEQEPREQRESAPKKSDTGPAGKGLIFMWKATSSSTEVYILGSLHYARKGLYPLDQRIQDAFAQSQALAVESDVDGKQARLQALVMQLGMYPEGDSLENHITPRTMDLLRKLGGANPLFMRMHPWLVAMQLQSVQFQKQGYDQDQGIDRHFLLKARSSGMEVLELERMEDTLKILADASAKDPDLFLYYSLLELERQDDLLGQISSIWQRGDAKAMHELIFAEINRRPEFKEFGVKLFDERNASMAEVIAGYLRGSRPVFVVVGAGHLVGPTGIPTLLRQKGFAVGQVGE
jgi:uncharacterized protein